MVSDADHSHSIDGTIERLGSAPDLYYLHRIDPNTALEESIPALDKIRKAGKTKYIGLSECSAQTLRKAHSSTLGDSFARSACYTADAHHSRQDRCGPSGVQRVRDRTRDRRSHQCYEGTGSGLCVCQACLIQATLPCSQCHEMHSAYSPLGHGWLVDDFPFKTPEDFAPDDFRRSCQ